MRRLLRPPVLFRGLLSAVLLGLLAAALSPSAAAAQSRISAIAGFQRSNFIGGGSGAFTWRSAYMGGVAAEVPLRAGFAFRPELHYSVKGSAAKAEGGGVGETAFRISYVQLPLMAQLATPGGRPRVNMYGGASAGVMLDCRIAEQACEDIADAKYSRFDLGLVFGTEVAAWGAAAGIRYEAGLRPVESSVMGSATYNGALAFTLRYSLSR